MNNLYEIEAFNSEDLNEAYSLTSFNSIQEAHSYVDRYKDSLKDKGGWILSIKSSYPNYDDLNLLDNRSDCELA